MAKGMQDILKQAQRMQRDMAKMQDELATLEFEGTAGGGQVKVKMNGGGDVTAVSLSKDAVDPNDVEMLEDLIVAAFRNAREKSNEAQNSRMSGLTGGLKIPGLM